MHRGCWTRSIPMRRPWLALLAPAVLIVCAAVVVSQPPPGNQPRPRFELGKVLPPFAEGTLELTQEQKEELVRLEKEVKGRLEKILTDEQQKHIKDLRQRGAGGPGRPVGTPGERSTVLPP